MLKFNDDWRYSSPGAIPAQVDAEFSQLIKRLAKDDQPVLEHFKKYFASAAGQSSGESSSFSWAATDMDRYMTDAAENAPVFIEAFYDAWLSLGSKYPPLNVTVINSILAKHNSKYQIDGDELIYEGQPVVASPAVPKSFQENARETIEKSLAKADDHWAKFEYKAAVQEILWLLETITTAFDGVEADGTKIEGKYFNDIIGKLRRSAKGTTLNRVIDWVLALHGYLSAPSGGGIRHGVHLSLGDAVTDNEALLYYNLIKSYITYFMGEYERLQAGVKEKSDLPF